MQLNQKDIDILTYQINSIIKNNPLEYKSISKNLFDLQTSILNLSSCITELSRFLEQLAEGNLEAKAPDRHNYLASSSKQLQSSLKHITWQATQVAKGDYSQKVKFMGDFSNAFNEMISQLAQREKKLKDQSIIMTETNVFLNSIIDGISDSIIVTDVSTGEVLYSNSSASKRIYDKNLGEFICAIPCDLVSYLKNNSNFKNSEHSYDFKCPLNNKIMNVKTYQVEFNQTSAYIHHIIDVTYQKEYQEQMEQIIYQDELTSLYNRRYFLIQLEEQLKKREPFCLCMIDIDGLKFANDNFGHESGDQYIKTVAKKILEEIRSTDIASRYGGDEMTILFPNCSKHVALKKLKNINTKITNDAIDYPMSISYGIVQVNEDNNLSGEILLSKADKNMYRHKASKKNY